jgi:hypothetical protein
MVTMPLYPTSLDFNDFATRGTTTDVERYKKQSAEFRKKVNTTTTVTASATKSAAVVPAKGKQVEVEDEEDAEDEESYDSMDYGDEFNDDEESAYKKEKFGEKKKGGGILKNTKN